MSRTALIFDDYMLVTAAGGISETERNKELLGATFWVCISAAKIIEGNAAIRTGVPFYWHCLRFGVPILFVRYLTKFKCYHFTMGLLIGNQFDGLQCSMVKW